ncbi:MAG TPA: PQQ-binding-like beta-propeller repeat protein [Methylomirabilota bacterium]|nr:PQQ-binding-like beta-propeller repeat protein [Methylomirabilota bacterium]
MISRSFDLPHDSAPGRRRCQAPILLLILATTAASAVHGAGDWPQWRGPARDGLAAATSRVPSVLPTELKPVWKRPIGGGFSSPVVAQGKLVYLDGQNGKEVAHALDADTGRELWQTPYADMVGDEWGQGPRSTPIIDGEHVYALACNGEFACLRLDDGRAVWTASYEKQFGVKFLGSKAREGTASRRGNNGSAVIAGSRLILPVGSTNGASLVCFDKLTGRVLWKSGHDEAAYSSLMVATLAGTKQVVAFTADALLGAHLETGEILWRVPLVTQAKRHAASPVVFGDHVAVNSHTIGLVCFKISKTPRGFEATEVWTNRGLKINLATPVLVGGHLYSQGANRDYVCVDAATGQLKWAQPGFGQGRRDYAATISFGKTLLVLTEDGQLLLLEPNPQRYVELGRLQVCGNTWSHPAWARDKLYVRDGRELICLDLFPTSTAAGL